MSSGELLLTLLIALLVFGPTKLPMLANHLGQLFQKLHRVRQQLSQLWEKQLQEQQLDQNLKKAQMADAFYKKDEPISDKEAKRTSSPN